MISFCAAVEAGLCLAQDNLDGWARAIRDHPLIVEARERNEQRRPVCSERLPEAERNLQANPRDQSSWETVGRCKLQQGSTEEAIAAFRHIIRMSPARADAYSLLGHALISKDEWEYGRQMFEAALRVDPDEDQAYRGLGAYHATAGNVREAIENYEIALKLTNRQGPNLFAPDSDYRTVAYLYPKLGKPLLTLKAFERAAQVFLIDDDLIFHHGLALIAVGKHDAARTQAKMLEHSGSLKLASLLNDKLAETK